MDRILCCCLLISCAGVLGMAAGSKCQPVSVSAQSQPIADNAELTDWVFDFYAPLIEVPEPSGLCFNPERNTLFIVDDGDIGRPAGVYELDLQAQVLASRPLGNDLEGICYCSADGLLYIADELDEHVYVIEPEGLALVREFQVSRFFNGAEVLTAGGNGFEGIEYIPTLDQAGHGDYFLLLNQDDPYAIVQVARDDIDTASNMPVPISAVWPVAEINTGELHYDVDTHELWVIHSWMNIAEILRVPTMEVLRWEVFPGAAQEAVTVDGDGNLWIGYDLGGIARYRHRNGA